jgi:hypothetical protein
MELAMSLTKNLKIRSTVAVLAVAAACPGLAVAQSAPADEQAPSAVSPMKLLVPQPPASGQETFPSAQLAVQSLVTALQKDDSAALTKILGPGAERIRSSGDPAEDQKNRQQFLDKYKQMHRLVTEQNGLTTLYIGAENFPTPIPLAKQGKDWYFDTPVGERVILYRRIGQNELTVIQVCGEMVSAEKEYDGQSHEYAQRFTSSPGQQNGLYWQSAEGQPQSPLGPFVAQASEEGYATGSSPYRTPFYGYYFRVLKAQGPNAPGGAKSYLVDGKMTGGFAILAYPAEYRSTGVMTFLVAQDGVVYQKDLGPHTLDLAHAIKAYDIDSTWQKADQSE